MSKVAVKLYKKAVLLLQREKVQLEKELSSAKASVSVIENRLREIYNALGETAVKQGGESAGKVGRKYKSKVAKKAVKKTSAKRRGRPSEKIVRKDKGKVAKKVVKKTSAKRSLKDVVLSITKEKSLDAKQIFNAACKAGHKFGGKNPMNSLRVMLYTNKKLFKNKKGKFTAA